jgi:mannose-6-phosphate isomerase-like protein (cupin superfamily)
MSQSEALIIQEEDCEFEGSVGAEPGSVRWRTLISGDRTPTDSLTVGVAELEPGELKLFRPHKHRQAEVYFILSGEGTVTISGNDYPVRPRTTIFIPGGAEHAARNTGADLLRLLYVFPADSFAEIEYEFPTS